MNAITYFLDVYLNTMNTPNGFQPTFRDRNHLITPDFNKIVQGFFSYGIIPLAAIPALLTVILLFIESEITLLECYKVNYVLLSTLPKHHKFFASCQFSG